MKRHRILDSLQQQKPDISEYNFHCQVAQFLNLILDCHEEDSKVVWTSLETSNHAGGRLGKILQSKDKAKGVKAGIPDIMILWDWKILFLELKTKSGVSDAQKRMHDRIRKVGHHVEVVRSLEEILQVFDKFNVPYTEVVL